MPARKYIILLLSIACVFRLSGQLSGTYTVGGTSPDFPNLDSAFNYMEIKGVSGKVRLHLRSGQYSLRTTISNISGTDSNKFIQISPDPGNTAPVVFKTKTDSVNNFLVNIKQSYLKFDSLTFVVDSSSKYGRIIRFTANCNSIRFNACNFYGRDTNTTSTDFAIIYHDSSVKADKIQITNCKFMNGSFGVYMDGPMFIYNDIGNKIINCSFQKYYYMAISLTYQDSLLVQNNYSKDINKYPGAYGYFINLCGSVNANSNRVYVNGHQGYGIFFNSSSGRYASSNNVYNNIICGYDTSKSGGFCALYISYLDNFHVAHNTVATFNKSPNSVALRINSNDFTKNSTFLNNLYYAENGYPLYHDTIEYGNFGSGKWRTSNILRSDYNFYYSKGKYFTNKSGNVQFNTLGNYSNLTFLDSHSINKKIVFENTEDLNSISIDLYKKGIPVKEVKYDITGRSRKIDKPDIGPYEFTPPTLDLAITDIINNSCSSNKDVLIKIKNAGITNIDSSLIMWQISENGSSFINQSNFTYKGKLSTGNDTLIRIGAYNFKPGNFTKVKVWVKTSNNKKDSISSNDSILTKPLLIQMGGDITIGGTSPYFTTIDSALRAAKRVGLCGPVRFLLRSGNYSEKLIFDSISGVSSINTISFISDPQNSKTPRVSYKAKGPNDNNIILLKNVAYVTISGISFYSLDTNYSRIVEIKEKVGFVSFTNDSFISKDMFITSRDSLAKKSTFYCNTGSNSPMLSVKNCVLKNNMVGINFIRCPQSQITGNTILNTGAYAIYFDFSDSIVIESNKIESYKNLPSNTTTPYLTGIYVRFNNCKVQKNKIILNSSRQYQYGIQINGTKKTFITNNSITSINPYIWSFSNCIVLDNYTDTTFFYNNSLYTDGGGYSQSNAAMTMGFSNISTNTYHIFNNNIMNFGTGPAMTITAYGSGYIKLKTQNNNLYTGGKNIINLNINAQLPAYYATLADWRNRNSDDTSSLSEKLKVINPNDLNLKSMKLKWKGLPNNIIKTDINGVKRDSIRPDIGAYVIVPVKKDLELTNLLTNTLPVQCGIDSSYISAVIFNNGGDTLSNFKLISDITGSNNQNFNLAFTYTKKLNPGAYDTVKLKKFSTSGGGYFSFKTYLNTALDSNTSNDTLYTKSLLLYSTPIPPKSKEDTLCDNKAFAFTLTKPANSLLKWYDSEKSNSFITINDTLRINKLMNDTTFYVSSIYQHGIPSSLKTTSSKGNTAYGGIMFNLKPNKDLNIDSFSSIFINSGINKYVIVYLKKGTFSGFETKTSKWTLTDSAIASPLDDSLEYSIKLRKPIKLIKDSLYAFYLNFAARVTSGTLSSNNNDLTFYNGAALNSLFGGVTPNSIFNGRIFYNIPFFCESEKVKYQIVIKKTKQLSIGKDTSYCANDGISYPLSSNINNSHYRWSNGDTTKSIVAKSGGLFSLTITDSNHCEISDSVFINKKPSPIVNFGPDVNYCASNGINLLLSPGSNYISYLWSNGVKTKNLTVKSPGIYSVLVTNNLGCAGGDTIAVSKITDPIVNLGKDTSYCSLERFHLKLDAGNNYKVYRWSNMDSTRTTTVNSKGIYIVEVMDDYNCKGSDTIIVSEKQSPVVQLPNDTFYCKFDNFSLLLDAGAGINNYQWSTGSNSQKLSVNTKGTYSVIVTAQNNCIGKDTIVISERYLQVDLGKDTTFCENEGIDKVLDAGPGFKKYNWMNGKNTQNIRVTGEGKYNIIVEGYNGCTAKDTITIAKNKNPKVNLGQDLVLNPDIPLNETLNAGAGHQSYNWSTNEKTQSIVAKKAGTYYVIVSDSNGCSGSDTINIRQWNKTNITSEILEFVTIFPNPANHRITLSSDHNVFENITITNSIGMEIYACKPLEQHIMINTEDWSDGIYFISYVMNGQRFQTKLTICH